MDSITQGLLGGTIAEAAFRGKLGGKAAFVGVMYGVLPDFDMALGFIDRWLVMQYHRGPTHSLLMQTLAAPALGWLAYRWANRKRTSDADPSAAPSDSLSPCRMPETPTAPDSLWTWVHLTWWVLITHSLLDWCTSYGTQLLWPLTDRRFALDCIFIIDPFYSVPLLAAFLLCRPRSICLKMKRRIAIAALVLTTSYLAFGYWQMTRARDLGGWFFAYWFSGDEKAEYVARPPVAIRAVPTPFNLFVWRVIGRFPSGRVETGVVRAGMKLDFDIPYPGCEVPTTRRFEKVPPYVRRDLAKKALRHPKGKLFSWFSDGWVTSEVLEVVNESEEDRVPWTISSQHTRHAATTHLVILRDRKYGFLTQPGYTPFKVVFEFDKDGTVLDVRRQRGALPHEAPPDFGTEFRKLWSLIRGK